MNSLNESSTMNMETSPPQEPPISPNETQSKEAIGALSRAYQDIFTTTQDRMNKRAGNINTSSRSGTFQNNPSQDVNYPHADPLLGYHSAPPTESKCQVLMDNNRYSYVSSFNQNHQSCSSPTPQPTQANYNSYPVRETKSKTCPFKLPAGSKVLVRNVLRCLSRCCFIIYSSNITF